jgi:hypothetical protein
MSEENKAVVKKAFDAINQGDAAHLTAWIPGCRKVLKQHSTRPRPDSRI